MVWPALIAAGASLAGSAISGRAQQKGAEEQNRVNREIAREQMAFQERMSSSAFQRSMADMRKAGLNPILAYQKGGASSPGGAAIPVVNEMAGWANSAQAAGNAISKGFEVTRLKEQLRNLRSDTALKDSQSERAWQETHKLIEDTRASQQLWMNLEKEGAIKDSQVVTARAAAQAAKASEEILKTKGGELARQIGTILRELNPLLRGGSAARSAK